MYHKYPYTDFHEMNLDWFLSTFEELLAEWEQMKIKFDSLQDALNALKQYVDNYFDSLDVQQMINDKLDEMAADGTLERLLLHILKTFDKFLDVANLYPAYQVWSDEQIENISAQSISIGRVNNVTYLLATLSSTTDETVSTLMLYNLLTEQKIYEVTGNYGHANSATFNTENGLFYITTDGSGFITFNPLTFEVIRGTVTIPLLTDLLGIAYDVKEDDGFYFYGTYDGNNVLGKTNSNFSEIVSVSEPVTRNKYLNPSRTYVQGIDFDGTFIYFNYGQVVYGAQDNYEDHGQTDIYDIDYNYINTTCMPFWSEFEDSANIDGKYYYYFQGNASGIIFEGTFTKDKNIAPSNLYGVDYGVVNRDNTAVRAYLGDRNNAKFKVDGSANYPFLNIYTLLRSVRMVEKVETLNIYINAESEITDVMRIVGSGITTDLRIEMLRNSNIHELIVRGFNHVYINASNLNISATIKKLTLTNCNSIQLRNINYTPESETDYAITSANCGAIEFNAFSNTNNLLIDNSSKSVGQIRLTNNPNIYQVVNGFSGGGNVVASAINNITFTNCGQIQCNHELTASSAVDITKIRCNTIMRVDSDYIDNPANEAGVITTVYKNPSLQLTYKARQHTTGANPIYNRTIHFSDNAGTIDFDSGWVEQVQSFYHGREINVPTGIPYAGYVKNNKLHFLFPLTTYIDTHLTVNFALDKNVTVIDNTATTIYEGLLSGLLVDNIDIYGTWNGIAINGDVNNIANGIVSIIFNNRPVITFN